MLSLLAGNQNLAAYGRPASSPSTSRCLDLDRRRQSGCSPPCAPCCANRRVCCSSTATPSTTPSAGILAGYLVYSGLVADPIMATALIQEILRRPLGPEARAVIPSAAGA